MASSSLFFKSDLAMYEITGNASTATSANFGRISRTIVIDVRVSMFSG